MLLLLSCSGHTEKISSLELCLPFPVGSRLLLETDNVHGHRISWQVTMWYDLGGSWPVAAYKYYSHWLVTLPELLPLKSLLCLFCLSLPAGRLRGLLNAHTRKRVYALNIVWLNTLTGIMELEKALRLLKQEDLEFNSDSITSQLFKLHEILHLAKLYFFWVKQR